VVFDPLPVDFVFPSYDTFSGIGFADHIVFGGLLSVTSDALIQELDFDGELQFHTIGDISVAVIDGWNRQK